MCNMATPSAHRELLDPISTFHTSIRFLRRLTLLVFLVCVAASISPAQSVLTQHNDNSRTGQNTNETILTTSNVKVGQFGKLFSLPVDGQVYAQPLYVPGVSINGATHNVLIVATEADSVYAFDADSNAAPLWKASLVDAAHGAGSGETPLNSLTTIGCSDLQPTIGITATPVIDPSSNTIYVEAKSTNGSSFFHRLHALALATGAEKSPGPALITATVNGTGDGSSAGKLTFDSLHQQARPGLLLVNGAIYVAFASHCDLGPYHGWIFAYDEATLTQKSLLVTTPNGGLGGFWMSGSGIAADASGNIYIPSGNGDFDTTHVPATELGDTLLKLGTTNANLTLLDYFTPFDQLTLNNNDVDLGSGGVLLLPDQPGAHPHIMVAAGKEGTIYVVDRDQMTTNNSHYCASGCSNDPEIVEESGSGAIAGVFGMPAYWNNTLYYMGQNSNLTSIPIANGKPDFTRVTVSPLGFGFPGTTPSISSNGTMAGAILWAIDSSQYGSPGPGPGPAVLHAVDPTNVSTELWNSTQAANNRDRAGNAVKFSVPTIVNGKVYVGTSTEVDVYGLTGQSFRGSVAPTSATIPVGSSHTFNVTVNPMSGFNGNVSFACDSPPSGISCQFNPPQVSLVTNNSGSSVLTVSVSAKPSAAMPRKPANRIAFPSSSRPLIEGIVVVLAVSICAFCFGPRLTSHRQRLGATAIALLAICLVAGLSSCGGGGGVGGGGGNPVTVQVAIQGNAGGTPSNLGALSITVP